MNEAEQFFYEHAGYFQRDGETEHQARERSARMLAAAEQRPGYLAEGGLKVKYELAQATQ